MSEAANLTSLFTGAHDDGVLSKDSLALALGNVDDLGAQINAALGTPVLDVLAQEVVLFTSVIDDSGSIRMEGNSQVVRDGHNTIIDSLRGAKQGDGIQVHCVYLNGNVLYPFIPVAQAPEMDTRNYNPNGGTPLYDQSITTLLAVLAKSKQFGDAGVPVRTVTVIVTDGADVGSQHSAADVAKLVKDLLRQETHIVAGMGIDDHGHTDFNAVFQSMGIPADWILTPGNSPSEIRKAFAMVSKSAVRASQAAGASFSKTAAGGFGG